MFNLKFGKWLFVICCLELQMPLPSYGIGSREWGMGFRRERQPNGNGEMEKMKDEELEFFSSVLRSPLLLAQSSTCPAEVEPLTSLLLQDLPSYANRVMQRSRRLERAIDQFSYVIVAGRPEFKPLTLGPGVYEPPAPTADVEPPQQVFFTTLERQYQENKAVEFQNFHWLFLVQTDGGWRLAMMFTRIGSPASGRPPMPPRESSEGVIGRAVSLWLRDCRAGAIRVSAIKSDRTLNLHHEMSHLLYSPK